MGEIVSMSEFVMRHGQLQINPSLVSYNTLKSRLSVLSFVSQISPKPPRQNLERKTGFEAIETINTSLNCIL